MHTDNTLQWTKQNWEMGCHPATLGEFSGAAWADAPRAKERTYLELLHHQSAPAHTRLAATQKQSLRECPALHQANFKR